MDRGFDGLAINLASDQSGLANAIHRSLRDALCSGRFPASSRMPASRTLARELGVSRNTVLEVYDRLIAEGFLSARRGAGTYVSATLPAPPTADRTGGIDEAPIDWLPIEPSTRVEFRPGLPDLRSFPIDDWRRSAMRGLRPAMTRNAGYEPALGDRALRKEISKYVSVSRAVRCDPDSVLVTSGAQQAFDILARVMIEPGSVVAVEEPGYPPAIAAFECAGARIEPVPVDGDGLIVSRLPENASVVCVTPSHQFPLGVTMSLERRHALIAWALARRAWIVEDDYDSEFRFAGRRLESLQGMAGSDRVAYVGSFSKVLVPAFRLGYAIVPAELQEGFLRVKWITDRHSSSPMQAILADFLETGGFARHLRRMQGIYQQRYDLMTRNLSDLPSDSGVLIPSLAGLHVTLMLNESIDASGLVADARRRDVGLYPLQVFCRQPHPPGLVLGFGNLDREEIEQGLKILRDLIARARRSR